MKIVKVWHHGVIFAWSLLMAGQVLASPDTGADPDAGYLVLFDGRCRLEIKETVYNIGAGHVANECKNFTVFDVFKFEGVRSAVSIKITTHTNLEAPYAINLRTVKDKVSTRNMTYVELMGAAVGKPYLPGLVFQGDGTKYYHPNVSKIKIEINK